MKRVISLLLVLTMCIISPVYASEENAIKTMGFLQTIGIMTEFTEETVQLDREITRAVFAENVVKLIGEGDTKCSKVYYHDISKDHWAFNCTGVLTELGFIRGDGDNNFNPDNIITKNEAITVLLSIMGYDAYAKANGGFPSGYLKIAGETKLTDGCTSNQKLIMQDMMKLFENALVANVVTVNITDGGLGIVKDENETLLSKYYGMYYDKGVLTAGDGLDILKLEEIPYDTAVIDGVSYDTALENLVNYLGTEVNYLYKAKSVNSAERELVWLDSTGKTEILEFEKGIYDEFDKESYTIEHTEKDSSKTKSIKMSNGIIVIYNNGFVKGNIEDILAKDRYDIKLVRFGKSVKYGLAIVRAYENYVVGEINERDSLIADTRASKIISLDENDYDFVKIRGMASTFNSINIGDVVSIYKSEDGKRIEAVVSSSVNNEILRSVYESDGVLKAITDEGEYEFFDKNARPNISIGSRVNIYKDFKGYIVDIRVVGTKSIPAYLIRLIEDDSDDKIYLKLLTTDGVIKKYECADKIKVDGTSMTENGLKSNFSVGSDTNQQIIIVDFDNDNRIKKIDTTEFNRLTETAENSLRVFQSSVTGIYRRSSGKVTQKVRLGGDTVIFAVPSSYSSSDDDYLIKTVYDLQDETTHTVSAYRYRDEKLDCEDIVVIYDETWGNGVYANTSFLVESIEECVNEDDEPVECITGFTFRGGRETVAYTNGKYSLIKAGIKSGDVVSLQADNKGNVTGANILYKYGGKSFVDTYITAQKRDLCVYINDKITDKAVIMVGYESGADYDEIFYVPDSRVIVYDSKAKTNKIRPIGSIAEAKTYQAMGNECSMAFIETMYGDMMFIYLYI